MAILHTARNFLTDVIYPPVCFVCDEPGTRRCEEICEPCLKKSRAISAPFCSICGESFAGEMTAIFRCPNCGDRRFEFDFAIAAWQFTGPVRTLLLGLKYGKKPHLRRVLARMMESVFEDTRLTGHLDDGWKIVPVPLHSRKYRERGFNQSLEIATALSELAGFPALDVLSRTRYTPSQARLTRKERMENIEGAFSMRPLSPAGKVIAGAPVFVLDDVFTTGATAQECARVLKQDGGASRVVVITVARG